MDAKSVTRKLSAVLSMDVQGYSRLMGDDEIATVKTITEYRKTVESLVTDWKGRVVDSPGDNILAEFTSVVDAVQCAVEIQHVLKAKNNDLPENRRMVFRIGVNLGDVIQEGNRIYGDGVNIAARIESLADGGGISISGTAYDHIENKLALGYEFFGEHTVKNIAKPVRVYKVPMEPAPISEKKQSLLIGGKKFAIAGVAVLIIAAAAVFFWKYYWQPAQAPTEVVAKQTKSTSPPPAKPKATSTMPEKPAIAVLPFTNMSDDPKQEYFSDGITEDIITDLSKSSGLLVISRNATFRYKGKAVNIKEIAKQLDVQYVLEGSVRKSTDRFRINAQLIDAITGHHVWAERYDDKIGNIFDIQDKITHEIISSLAVKLTPLEIEKMAFKGTKNIEAYDALLMGRLHARFHTAEGCAKAEEYFKRAIKLDPNYAEAYSELAIMYAVAALGGFSKSLQLTFQECRLAFNQAKDMAMQNPTPLAHIANSWIHTLQYQHDEAIAEANRGYALAPNDGNVCMNASWALVKAGMPEEGITIAKKSLRLDPACVF